MSLETYSESGHFARHEVRALGTENVLLLAGQPRNELDAAAQEAFETVDRLEQALSKFVPHSDVGLLNALGASQPVQVGQDLLRILELSRQAWEATAGAYDPTVGELLHAWGLVDLQGRIPGDAELAGLRSRTGFGQVGFDVARGVAWLERPGVSIDLGAIGKGYIVDVVVERLKERGVSAGLFVSGRSSLVAWGLPPDGKPWCFEVVHPTAPQETLCELEAEAGAISSSGAYARRFVRGWKEYGHVLDPRTGRPAAGLKAATVWTSSAVLGDVLSTSLFVLGRVALDPGGCVERLAGSWAPPGEEPRVSVLWVEEDSSQWGGLRIGTFHLGRPAFTISSQP